MVAYVASWISHLIPAVHREEHTLPMAASFTAREGLTCELSIANTPVTGGMSLSPGGGNCSVHNSIYYTDLLYFYTPILCSLFSTPTCLCKMQLDMPLPCL